MRFGLLMVVSLMACGPSEPDACELYEEFNACPECADGTVSCTFEEVTRTEVSCGGCQATVSLYQALCEAGSTATSEEIQDGMVCEDVEPGG